MRLCSTQRLANVPRVRLPSSPSSQLSYCIAASQSLYCFGNVLRNHKIKCNSLPLAERVCGILLNTTAGSNIKQDESGRHLQSLSLSHSLFQTHTLTRLMINLISLLAVSSASALISLSPDLPLMRRGESETVIKC